MMKRKTKKWLIHLVLASAIGLVSCDRSKATTITSTTPTPQTTKLLETKPAVISPHQSFSITSVGIGPIKLGMTLEVAKQAIPEATFKRTSDGDGAALIDVIIGNDSVMTLYAGEENPDSSIDWSKKIDFIESFSPACETDAGIKAGSLVLDAEKVYGKTQSIVRSEIESREYIEFQKNPKHFTFRIDYTGLFPDGSRETTLFKPEAKIHSITVSNRE